MLNLQYYVEVNFKDYPGTLADLDIRVSMVRGACRVAKINTERGMALVTSLMRPRGCWVPLFALEPTTHHHSERRGIAK